MELITYIICGVIGIIGLVLLSGIRIVRPTERAVIETLGKYTKFGTKGFNYIIPLFQRMIRVNITQRMADVEPLDMITKDNLNANVDLVVYYQVKDNEEDVKKALYHADNVKEQIISLAQTTARNEIGDMVFRDVNSKRNVLNVSLAKTLDKESNDWGIKVVRVELKEITPPKDVQETMNRVIKAENEKDAAKDFATAKETEADGERRSSIKIAEGKKQASILEAEGKAKAFELIEKSFKGNAQLDKRLDVARDSLKDNAKIVLTDKGITPTIILGEIPTTNKKQEK